MIYPGERKIAFVGSHTCEYFHKILLIYIKSNDLNFPAKLRR